MATVTITGTLVNAISGTPHAGRGWIEPSVPIAVNTGTNAVLASGVGFTLDPAGSFSVTVPATDDTALLPPNVRYRLTFNLSTGEAPQVEFAAPAATPTLDLSDIYAATLPARVV